MSCKKTNRGHSFFVWNVILAFTLTVVGKAGACDDPSAMEMSQGKAMDCCMVRCRMETTHEAAQKACASSRLALSPKETLSSPHNACNESLTKVLSDFNPTTMLSSTLHEPDRPIKPVLVDPPPFPHALAVPIYTTIQSFLI